MTEINSMPIKVMYDEDSNPFVPFVSLEAIGEINGENINEILGAKLEADNIKAGNQIDIEVKDGDVIIHNSATGLTVVDNLETENPGEGALDARQGKVLKDSIPEVVNNLNTIDSDKALSAHQGYILAGRSVPVGGAEGQVLKKSADNDYALEWGDAADPNAIIGDGSIKKIVELTYSEYLALKDLGYLDSETEYHINDWTESGHSEIKAEQVFLSNGENVETSLQSKTESLVVDVVLNPLDFSVISTSHHSEDIINAHQEGKKIYFHIDYTNGTCISTLDLIEGTSVFSQLILRMYDGSSHQVFLLRLAIGKTEAQIQRDRLLTEDDTGAINDALEAFASQVAEHVDERFESQGVIDDGQNTRLDIAESNIDAVVNTVNSHATQLGALTVSSGYWYPDLAVVGQNTRPTWTIESRRANYYRIGRLVFVDFYIKGQITALPSNTNYAIITGLPYSATNNASFGQQALAIGTVYSALTSTGNLAFVVNGNQIRIQDGYGSWATEYKLTTTDYFELAGSGTYIID